MARIGRTGLSSSTAAGGNSRPASSIRRWPRLRKRISHRFGVPPMSPDSGPGNRPCRSPVRAIPPGIVRASRAPRALDPAASARAAREGVSCCPWRAYSGGEASSGLPLAASPSSRDCAGRSCLPEPLPMVSSRTLRGSPRPRAMAPIASARATTFWEEDHC